jgi:hypothetical protein
MLFSAAGVAFTPTLRPHVTQPTARAAVVCGLDSPVPPVATFVLDAAARQAAALRPASVSEAAASEVFPSAQQSIFPTNLLAAELFGQGKKFTGYKNRNAGPPADLAPAAEPDYSDTSKYEPTKEIDLSNYLEKEEATPADAKADAKAKEAQAAKEAKEKAAREQAAIKAAEKVRSCSLKEPPPPPRAPPPWRPWGRQRRKPLP